MTGLNQSPLNLIGLVRPNDFDFRVRFTLAKIQTRIYWFDGLVWILKLVRFIQTNHRTVLPNKAPNASSMCIIFLQTSLYYTR